jgi:photosystem II stability/assembly factor-like uncharacterized protein
MKKIFGFLVMIIFLVNTTIPLNAQWVQTSTPAPGQIQCIAISGNDLFEGNGQGQVFHSTDDGVTWTDVTSNLHNHAVNIGCLAYDGTNLLAVDSDGGGIFLSTNKGTSWTAINNGVTDPWINIVIINGINFYAGSDYGEVFVSANSGTNWSRIGSAFCNSRVCSIAGSASNLFASTQSNGVFRSVIGDTSWTAINSGLPSGTLVTNLVVKGSNLFAAVYGSGGGVFLSTNNGDTWTLPSNEMTSDGAYSLAIYPATKGTASTNLFAGTMDNHGIFLTTDNGASWQSVGLAIAYDGVEDLKVGNGKLFALTVGEEIWRRPLSEMISSVNEISGLPNGLLLRQNYPNPVIASTTISWRLPEKAHVILKIIDFMGREVNTLLDCNLSQGEHIVNFDASGLTSGVYCYQLQADGKIETQKMIVNK